MEVREIHYFLALSRTLNFTRAAEACHVTQPALTRAIRKMEQEFGGLLVSRERNNTHMTALGRAVQPHLEQVVARAEAAKTIATHFLKLEKAHLAIGVMSTLSPAPFGSFLNEFRTSHPGIEVTLQEAPGERLCELLLAGDLEVALMASRTEYAAPLEAFELFTERFVVACAPTHRFALQDAVPLAQIGGEVFYARANCEYADFLGNTCREQGITLNRACHSDRADWILNLIAAGAGISLLPEFTAYFPGVVARPVVMPSLERKVHLVTIAGRTLSSPGAAVAGTVREFCWTATEGSPPLYGRQFHALKETC